MAKKFQEFVARHPDRTHAEWAEVLGCSRSHFTMMLNGTAQPGKKLMLKIEEASGGYVPVVDWFTPSQQPERVK